MVNRAKGFTLVELLIAFSLFAVLMLTATFSYSFMQQNWQRVKHTIATANQQYQNFTLLYTVLVNTYPRLILTEEKTPYTAGFYFLGRQDGFTAVTSQSMQLPNTSAVYRLFKEPDPLQHGRWQLVYEEALLADELLLLSNQNLPFEFRRILLVNQPNIEFRYQGWLSFEEKNTAESHFPPSPPAWHNSYDGLKTRQNPHAIEVISGTFHWLQHYDDDGLLQLNQLDEGI